MNDLNDPSTARQSDRLPPADLEAEQALLGSLLVPGGIEYVAQIRAMIADRSFYQPDNGIIFGCICRLADAGKPIDAVMVRAELIAAGTFEEIGGASYLATLLQAVPSAAHAAHYAEIVREKANCRAIIRAANEAVSRVFRPSVSADQATGVAMEFADQLLQIATRGQGDDAVKLEEAVWGVIESFDDPKPRFIPTGLADLDAIIGGVFYGQTTVIGGQAGMGKSQLAKQIVKNAATAGVPCGIVTVEEDRRKIAENYLSAASGIDNYKIAFRRMNGEEISKIVDAAQRVAPLPIWIQDSAFSITEITAAVQTLVAKHGCRLIVIDHLHLIDGESDGGSREREVSKISGVLKKLFRRLDVAGIVVAQLNRSHQPGERPTLRSLRDSGALEQDADKAILLYREDYFRYREKGYIPSHRLEAIVAKNKSGAPGTAFLRFDGRIQTVSDAPADPFHPGEN